MLILVNIYIYMFPQLNMLSFSYNKIQSFCRTASLLLVFIAAAGFTVCCKCLKTS